jgi:hypothetical protein
VNANGLFGLIFVASMDSMRTANRLVPSILPQPVQASHPFVETNAVHGVESGAKGEKGESMPGLTSLLALSRMSTRAF